MPGYLAGGGLVGGDSLLAALNLFSWLLVVLTAGFSVAIFDISFQSRLMFKESTPTSIRIMTFITLVILTIHTICRISIINNSPKDE